MPSGVEYDELEGLGTQELKAEISRLELEGRRLELVGRNLDQLQDRAALDAALHARSLSVSTAQHVNIPNRLGLILELLALEQESRFLRGFLARGVEVLEELSLDELRAESLRLDQEERILVHYLLHGEACLSKESAALYAIVQARWGLIVSNPRSGYDALMAMDLPVNTVSVSTPVQGQAPASAGLDDENNAALSMVSSAGMVRMCPGLIAPEPSTLDQKLHVHCVPAPPGPSTTNEDATPAPTNPTRNTVSKLGSSPSLYGGRRPIGNVDRCPSSDTVNLCPGGIINTVMKAVHSYSRRDDVDSFSKPEDNTMEYPAKMDHSARLALRIRNASYLERSPAVVNMDNTTHQLQGCRLRTRCPDRYACSPCNAKSKYWILEEIPWTNRCLLDEYQQTKSDFMDSRSYG